MHATGLSFHPEVSHPTGPTHLILSVRRHHVAGYTVRGPRECEIGQHHPTAREAACAIRQFCRARGYTARASVYDPDGALWTIVEIL